MRKYFKLLTILAIAFCMSQYAFGQDDFPFDDGSVYQVTMTKTNANSQGQYLRMLSSYYIPFMEKAKAAGLIKSFKVLSGASANEDDFDVMVMIEYENMAAFDSDPARDAKWEAVQNAMRDELGGQEKISEITSGYVDVRQILGRKLMREQIPN